MVSDEARKLRKRTLNFAPDNHGVVFKPHFPVSSAGKVIREGSGFRWQFI
jgi:hypothetical protein